MIIAIDFDGTVVTHEYPAIGRDLGAVPVLRALTAKGHKLILFTMRSGEYLADAAEWFQEKGIPLWGVNENPTQHKWTDSPKCYANLYIDDAAFGCPLLQTLNTSERPYADWKTIGETLSKQGVI